MKARKWDSPSVGNYLHYHNRGPDIEEEDKEMIECPDCEATLKYCDKLEETIQGKNVAIQWLEEQNEKMKVLIIYLAEEGCNRVGHDFSTMTLRKCYESDPDFPDMWCYPCRAIKILENK
jgi:hypothetical protein